MKTFHPVKKFFHALVGLQVLGNGKLCQRASLFGIFAVFDPSLVQFSLFEKMEFLVVPDVACVCSVRCS